MIYQCCSQYRKGRILSQIAAGKSVVNGLDYLEVLGSNSVGLPWQQHLFLHCLGDVTQLQLIPDNILIEGGVSITGIQAISVQPAVSVATPAALVNIVGKFTDIKQVLVVEVNEPGDFSTYRLRLVNSVTQASQDPFEVTATLSGFDPQLAAVKFSFKVECDFNFDCAPIPPDCAPPAPIPPPINYLAKDYGSFRSIILDRLNQLLPQWGGSSEADLGVVLAELLAYAGDHISYRQDATGTEAYLETARSRISLRRHARLVDYHVHDGSNARAWIQLQVAGNPGTGIWLDRNQTPRFYTRKPGAPTDLSPGSNGERAALLAGVVVFEARQSAMLFPEHNQISFYTWGESECCLPNGATQATLLGSLTNLQPGDILIFQEVLGPKTGDPADADVRHRCAVRLTNVTTLTDTLPDVPVPVTEIEWAEEDALPFPVCLSSNFLNSDGKTQPLTDVSVAFGNVILADHGLTLKLADFATVPVPDLFLPPDPAADHCQPVKPPVPVPVRFRPTVPDGPLTQAASLSVAGAPNTPGTVSLGSSGLITLTDGQNVTSLVIQLTATSQWPQNFSVLAAANGANFDLTVLYQPPGAAVSVMVEHFTNLTTQAGNGNVITQINGVSQLIQITSVLTANPPANYSPQPTALNATGPVTLNDASNNGFLVIQITPAADWPILLGVTAQAIQSNPPKFNLGIVYNPVSGGIGVTLPVVVEQFNNVTSATVGGLVSNFITIISFVATPDPGLSACELIRPDTSECLPVISLDDGNKQWKPAADLLELGPTDCFFVVEVESDGNAQLRFGDNVNGEQPETDTLFQATYRVGNGAAGNVGVDSLIFMYVPDSRIQSCRNPLPAGGGTEPETNDQIRRRAPQAFLTQERAVTMADYANWAEANPQVDRAVANLRWTGSWYTVFVAVEPQAGSTVAPALARTLKKELNRYRLAGQDLDLDSPQYISLEIDLQICIDPYYFEADVVQSLLQVLSNRILPDGRKGFFYPTNFTFGQTVYLSLIYAAARTVPGVVTVTASKFQVQGVDSQQFLDSGELPIGPLQVARLDNDRNFPDHGVLNLFPEGGK
jgi:hypothetical protein